MAGKLTREVQTGDEQGGFWETESGTGVTVTLPPPPTCVLVPQMEQRVALETYTQVWEEVQTGTEVSRVGLGALAVMAGQEPRDAMTGQGPWAAMGGS
ncbi:hypothetical protein DPX16_23480 [Anabarilius grahami]|uniref:Uncharacterized protein n=1 Tax=Anabarilius grahami TaxID=495550 RepID=A0A3N0Z228_ANAGA|nr:hypothetical protein DPX16_23480 [Anabarilius grahami]